MRQVLGIFLGKHAVRAFSIAPSSNGLLPRGKDRKYVTRCSLLTSHVVCPLSNK
jgi:hypothetical protein